LDLSVCLEIIIKTDILRKTKPIIFSFVFLPSFEKERRKMNQKEERKTVVGRNGTLSQVQMMLVRTFL